MGEPTETRVRANGLDHHVLTWSPAESRVAGAPGSDAEPATVVLCHGFLDQAFSYAEVGERLAAEGLRAVAFDWRGHGTSDHVGPGGYYHFADYVLDLHELMPSIAGRPTHLVGHSMGGTASCLYAATHRGELASLTVIEGLGPPQSETPPAAKMRTWLDTVTRSRAKPARDIADLDDAVRRLRAQNPELPEPRARFLAEKATRPSPNGAGLRWTFDPLHRTTSPSPFDAAGFMSFLAEIDAPTLVVTGERGFRTADHQARVDALPDSREVLLPEVGHMIHQLRPLELARLIAEHARSASA